LGLCLISMNLLVLPASAQQLNKEEIIKQLLPQKPITRKITVVLTDPDAAIKEKAGAPKLDMRVTFEYNSAALTPEGISLLKPLGEALQDQRLQKFGFLIGGHTDAKGSDGYNQSLSDRRANSVRAHLISVYHVTPDRLQAISFGQR